MLLKVVFTVLTLPYRPHTRRFLLPLISLILLLFLFSPSYGAPVMPNKAILEGTVKEYCSGSSELWDIKPEQVIYKLSISVEVVRDSEVFPNFLKGKEGQLQSFFTKEKISPELLNKRVRAEVEYRGDEKGGRFWIRAIEIINGGPL
jgi:hypothetical protein